MIVIRPATQEDLDIIRKNPIEENIKDYPYHELKGEATVSILGDKLLSIGGLVPMWNNVAEAWVVFSKNSLDVKIEAMWIVREELERMIKNSNFKRIQATIRADFPKAIEMIKFLGFKNETPDGFRYYFPDGCTAYIYARYK